MTNKLHNDTLATRCGIEWDKQFNAVVPPLYLSSNFSFDGFEQKAQYDYTRSGNPNRDLLAEALAGLEGGAGGVITSTGMSAITLVLQLLCSDDFIVVPHDCYGGTYRLLDALHKRKQFEVAFVDFSDEKALAAALSKKPKIVWIETPSNPLLRIVDIASISDRAKQVGALTVVDNTFLSPALQKPLTLGADIVVHSTTKYINGHSDVVGGAVIAKEKVVLDELAWWANCIGITGSPFDSFLTLRGLRTIHARWRIHEENAAAIATLLSEHAMVESTIFPGLPEHPDHELAKVQQSGFGAMLSFKLKGDKESVRKFLSRLKCFSLAESLGGVESLIAHPASMTHAAMDESAQIRAGITPNLLRLSIGIENKDDLINDLKSALDYCANADSITYIDQKRA